MRALRSDPASDPDATRVQETVGLRSFRLPYAHAQRTWVMEVDGAALVPARPAASTPGTGTTGQLVSHGFWSDVPEDEVREPVLQMDPTNGRDRKREEIRRGVDLREVAMFVGLTYLVMGLSGVVVMFLCHSS